MAAKKRPAKKKPTRKKPVGANRDGSGKFAPGASGNPGGRPSRRGIVAYVLEQTDNGNEIAEFLIAVMRGKSVKPPGYRGRATYPGYKERIAAARELLDQTYGRAPVSVELEAGDTMGDQMQRAAEALARKLDQLAAGQKRAQKGRAART